MDVKKKLQDQVTDREKHILQKTECFEHNFNQREEIIKKYLK